MRGVEVHRSSYEDEDKLGNYRDSPDPETTTMRSNLAQTIMMVHRHRDLLLCNHRTIGSLENAVEERLGNHIPLGSRHSFFAQKWVILGFRRFAPQFTVSSLKHRDRDSAVSNTSQSPAIKAQK